MALKNNRLKSEDPFEPQADDDLIICRCEEITKGEIRKAIYDGMRTMTELRRYLRSGMGLCQGQTCTKLVKSILARELHENPSELESAMSRAPVRPVEMRVFGNERKDFSHNG
jgi:NAD(P)H-nitrite reductase large subunit